MTASAADDSILAVTALLLALFGFDEEKRRVHLGADAIFNFDESWARCAILPNDDDIKELRIGGKRNCDADDTDTLLHLPRNTAVSRVSERLVNEARIAIAFVSVTLGYQFYHSPKGRAVLQDHKKGGGKLPAIYINEQVKRNVARLTLTSLREFYHLIWIENNSYK